MCIRDSDDRYQRRVIHVSVEIKLHHRRRHVFGGAAETRAMIGADQVVIDRFGNADNPALVIFALQVLAYFIASVHRVVTAVIKEITDIVFFENFVNSYIIGLVFFLSLIHIY